MTEEAGWVALGVKPVLDRGFGSGLSRSLDPTLGRVASASGRRFGSILGKAAVVGAAGIIGAGFAAFRLGQGALEEARESQKVSALTASTIRALGHDAGETSKQVGKLATTLSHKSAIDDETIQSGLNVLLTNKAVRNDIGKGNNIFDKAAKRATDYAAALASQTGSKPNIATAAKLVSKALGDPVKAISTLRRANVFFTQQQQDSIKAFVAQNDVIDAQKVILGGLKDRYGGAAKEQATMGEKVALAWSNIQERLGKAILPLVDQVEKAILTKGMPVFRHWVKDFRDNGIPVIEHFADVFRDKGIPMLKRFFDQAKPVAEDILPKLANVLGTVKDDLSIAAPYAKDLVDAFIGMPDWAKKLIVGGGLAAFAGNKLGLGSLGKSAGGGLLGLVTKAKPLPVFVVNGGLGGTGIPGVPTGIPKGVPKGVPSTPLLGLPILPGAFPDAPTGVIDKKDLLTKGEFEAIIDAKNAKSDQQKSGDLFGLLTEPFGKKNVQSKFELLGMVEAEAKVDRLRKKAGKPIEVPIVAKFDAALANFFGDILGSGVPDDLLLGPTSPNKRGSVNVNIGSVAPHDYKDFMGNMQQRSQMAQLDGIAR